MLTEKRFQISRIIACAILFIGSLIFFGESEESIWVYLGIYIAIGYDVVWGALKNIFRGQIFDENFLMSIASIGAFVIGDYPEAVAVVLFYQVGDLFEDYAVGRSRKSIKELMNIAPDYAVIKREGKLVKVDPNEIKIGDVITVSPGEKIPLDGNIVSGVSSVDSSALTGESLPSDLTIGDVALSGCINLTGVLEIKVTKEFGESTVSKILELVEKASSKKAKTEKFITKFAKYYTPVVVISAVILAVVPPLVLGESFVDWVNRAFIFLVISCPCALVISVPMGFFGGIGGASKQGILIKGSNYLEALAKVDTVVFDKTGTLTKGVFEVEKINSVSMPIEQLLEYVASAESYSNHPISLSLKRAYTGDRDLFDVEDYKEIAGRGVFAKVDGMGVHAGNTSLMDDIGVRYIDADRPGTIVHVAIDGKYEGQIIISDEIKEDSLDAVKKLKQGKVSRVVMLTGDSEGVARFIGEKIDISDIRAKLLPENKVEEIERIKKKIGEAGNVVFVGDGINDAPVLAMADVGVAMGALGSDAAIEAADVVIMDDKPSKVATVIDIAKRTMKIVKQNIIFALGIKLVILILGVFGLASMWMAVFADVGVAILAILNSMRTLRK